MRATSCLRFASGLAHWLSMALVVATVGGTTLLFAQEPDGFDVRLFHLINDQQNPEKTGFFEILDYTSLPSYAVIPAGFLAVGAFDAHTAEFQTGLMLVASEGLTLGCTSLLKALVGRNRPFEDLTRVKLKHAWSAGGRSFPSGHTSMAFSIATMVSLQYRSAAVTVPMILWASFIGYGRIYLGVHYPSDVLGGALLGTAISVAVWQFRGDFLHASESIVGKADPVTDAARTGRPIGVTLARVKLPFH